MPPTSSLSSSRFSSSAPETTRKPSAGTTASWGTRITHGLLRVFLPSPPAVYDADLLQVDGLKKALHIVRDEKGIPYIYAQNEEDGIFATGMLHALERPWQMECIRRAASGTLSELFGKATLQTDLWVRTIGVPRVAIERFQSADPRVRSLMEAYAAGVNYGDSVLTRRPFEVALLRADREWKQARRPWEALDTMRVHVFTAVLMVRGRMGDLTRQKLQESIPAEFLGYFEMKDDPSWSTVNVEEKSGPSMKDREGNAIDISAFEQPPEDWARFDGALSRFLRESENPEGGDGADILPVAETDAPTAKATTELIAQAIEENLRDKRVDERLPRTFSRENRGAGGSNAWSISGDFTQSGKPLVSGDPHLAVEAPCFWFPLFLSVSESRFFQMSEMRAKGGEFFDGGAREGGAEGDFRVMGGSVPGDVGVFVGHTDHAAWSLTLGFGDQEDFFALTLSETDNTKYLFDGKEIPLRMRRETIHYKESKMKEVTYTVLDSHFGPIVNNLIPRRLWTEKYSRHLIALASTPLRAESKTSTAIDLWRATCWEDFYRASLNSPEAPLLAAAAFTSGDLGTFIFGSYPRRRGPHKLIRDGSTSEDDWQGLLDKKELPHTLNQSRGFEIAANNKIAEDISETLGRQFLSGTRGAIIRQRLETFKKGQKLTVEEMQKLQLEDVSPELDRFKNLIANVIGSDEETVGRSISSKCPGIPKKRRSQMTRLTKEVQDWDSRATAESSGCSVADVWMRLIPSFIFGNLGWDGQMAFQGMFADSMLSESDYETNWWSIVSDWLGGNDGREETAQGQKLVFDPLFASALNEALNRNFGSKFASLSPQEAVLYGSLELTAEFFAKHYRSARPAPAWGDFRAYILGHRLGIQSRWVRKLLSPQKVLRPGGGLSVNALTPKPHIICPKSLVPLTPEETSVAETYNYANVGVSMRMNMDTGNWRDSNWIFPAGVSGWIGTEHYEDMVDDFAAGKTMPMRFFSDDIFGAKRTFVTLSPARRKKGSV